MSFAGPPVNFFGAAGGRMDPKRFPLSQYRLPAIALRP
jgi:hypothetical protein